MGHCSCVDYIFCRVGQFIIARLSSSKSPNIPISTYIKDEKPEQILLQSLANDPEYFYSLEILRFSPIHVVASIFDISNGRSSQVIPGQLPDDFHLKFPSLFPAWYPNIILKRYWDILPEPRVHQEIQTGCPFSRLTFSSNKRVPHFVRHRTRLHNSLLNRTSNSE